MPKSPKSHDHSQLALSSQLFNEHHQTLHYRTRERNPEAPGWQNRVLKMRNDQGCFGGISHHLHLICRNKILVYMNTDFLLFKKRQKNTV